MYQLRAFSFAVVVALAAGCSKGDKENTGGADRKGGPAVGKLTTENMARIRPGLSNLNEVRQIFGSSGEMTNDEKPGLLTGNRFVWKEDGKKAYVSIGIDGNVNGVAWEGFGGK